MALIQFKCKLAPAEAPVNRQDDGAYASYVQGQGASPRRLGFALKGIRLYEARLGRLNKDVQRMKKPIVSRPDSYKVERYDWGELTWYVSKEQGNSKGLTIGKCLLNPGFANPRHSHPNCEEVLHVLQGKIVHTIEGGKEVEMLEGDSITIPPNTPHCARNVGDLDAVLLICFSSAERQVVGE